MKTLLLLLISLPLITFAQRTYEITGMMATSERIAMPPGIAKVKAKITITDSSYTYQWKEQVTAYKIIKKVDDNYFRVSDGLKEYNVRINNQKVNRYSGVIVQEGDKETISMFFK